jgi:hypothetical protein
LMDNNCPGRFFLEATCQLCSLVTRRYQFIWCLWWYMQARAVCFYGLLVLHWLSITYTYHKVLRSLRSSIFKIVLKLFKFSARTTNNWL